MCNTWKTKDGQLIPVNKLTDDHIKNILNKFPEGKRVAYIGGNSIDEPWCDMVEIDIEGFDAVKHEAIRRALI